MQVKKVLNRDWEQMTFYDLRKPNMAHLYYVYVYPLEEDEKAPAVLYKLGSVMELKRKLSDQHRKFDIVKVW